MKAEVETLLLTTKLNIPPARPQIVPRPHLIERLQEGLNYNLILVSAPAGFGKTTLLSEWIRKSQPPTRAAWVSLDEGENDPVRFWDYLIAALKILQPAFGESTLALLHSPQPPPVESLLTALINELGVISFNFVIVLDDYHVITSQPIYDGIIYLLEHLPPRMHLVIASRADPPLPLARFRGKGTMLEIHTDDLRFSREEAVTLLEKMKSPELSPDDVSALNERTEGWAVGLKMAALSLRHQKDIPGFIASFAGSQRYIMDYLMEEVLRQQSQEVQDFLLKTSVLERLTAPLCDAVTGRKDSLDMLPLLERSHLFIVPLDESRQWYRYEHLFADILRHQLEVTFGVEKVAGLNRLASQWYEEHKFPDDAMHHAREAKDWERVVRLIKEQQLGKMQRGEFVTLLNWLRVLPEDILQTHVHIDILYNEMMLVTGQLDTAETRIKTLEKAAQGNESLKGDIAGLQAIIAYQRGDLPLFMELAPKALPLVSPEKIELLAYLKTMLGVVYSNYGNLTEAELLITERYEAGRQTGYSFTAVFALSVLARIMYQRGKLRRAAELCQQAIKLAGPSASAITPLGALGSILYEWNDLEAACNHVQRAIELYRFSGSVEYMVSMATLLVYIRFAQGDEVEAMKAAENACSIAQNISGLRHIRAGHAAFHIIFALRQGDLATASAWGNKLSGDLDVLPFSDMPVLARLLIAQDKKSEAMEKLQTLYDQTVQGGAESNLVKISMYQALTAATQESALEFLADALRMAEPEGYIRTFVDEGKLLAPLLRKAVAQGIMPEYTGKLLAIIEVEERRKLQRVEGAPSRPPELLSEREIEVLRLLAEGLSNRQIAERLFITIGTAKTHVHNIIEKLYVKGRTQAISRARELKLI